MTRNEMNLLIRNWPDVNLREEVSYHVHSVDREYPYDEVCAILDIEERYEEALRYEREASVKKECRHLLNEARSVLIELGYYRVLTQEEIDNTWSSSGVKWAFKRNGVAYDCESATAEEWFNGAES